MNLQDRLRFKSDANGISFQPHRDMKHSLLWSAGIIAVIVVVLLLFGDWLGERGQMIGLAIVLYCVVHVLIDYLFRRPIRYRFDLNSKTVYRESPLFGKRKLMHFDEVTIFTSSDTGDWYYSLGVKKKQFLKSYKISPSFGAGKKAEQRAMTYEEEILEPLMKMLETARG
ncbi:hypothetical protein SAMN05660206_10521 [Sphingobacterium wenxiniae]|uniref:Uncharacterized protein n=2 Tax=Sphingobacterium wenxiniae TaxID=683125 RepID=A0A1I6SPX1_9SPHI|nr:hypothetical protein SAMN05660206_10521 [Sphingobacterium wenxiniae]